MGPGDPELDARASTPAWPIGILPREGAGIAGVTSGTVKWVDVARAHGAIETDVTGPWEICFHFSCVDGQDPEPPTAGDRVEVRYLRLDLDRFKYVAHLVRVVAPPA